MKKVLAQAQKLIVPSKKTEQEKIEIARIAFEQVQHYSRAQNLFFLFDMQCLFETTHHSFQKVLLVGECVVIRTCTLLCKGMFEEVGYCFPNEMTGGTIS